MKIIWAILAALLLSCSSQNTGTPPNGIPTEASFGRPTVSARMVDGYPDAFPGIGKLMVGTQFFATGTLVSANTVLTAAHVARRWVGAPTAGSTFVLYSPSGGVFV